jgi:Cd2+/Zn2+-exporting ATPase
VSIWILGGLAAAGALLLPIGTTSRLFLYVIAYLAFGGVILLRAVRGILRGRLFDENTLMAIATLAAFAIGEYPEAVAVALFYRIGAALQERAADRSRASIRSLVAWRPDTGIRLYGEDTQLVAPEEVMPGDHILVRPGERISIDGRVVTGESSLDVSALTGEALPRDVVPGDEVLSGSVNGGGFLELEVLRHYRDSAASRILDSVERSAARKARAERFITRFARIYTPAMVAIAFVMAVGMPLLTGDPWRDWIYRACMLLVVSCPCGLVLSVPLGYFAGIGAAARRGILVKGGMHLDRLAAVRTLAFDKTGTLTHGSLRVSAVEAAQDGPLDLAGLRRYAYILERHSTHPVAIALSDAFADVAESPAGMPEVSQIREWAGRGMEAAVEGHVVLGGNPVFLATRGVSGLPLPDRGSDSAEGAFVIDAQRSVLFAVDGRYAGRVALEDRIRSDAATRGANLAGSRCGRIVMLTGDSEDAARIVSATVGVEEYHAHLLPDDKVTRIEGLIREQAGAGTVAFAGDGINDAPVLARADTGIAMGAAGSDAAVESADIVILSDRLGRIGEAIRIARKTARVARQNVAVSLAVKAGVLLLASAGWGGIWQAVFADVGIGLIAVLNALRASRI